MAWHGHVFDDDGRVQGCEGMAWLRGDKEHCVRSKLSTVRPNFTVSIVFAVFAKLLHQRCSNKWPKEFEF